MAVQAAQVVGAKVGTTAKAPLLNVTRAENFSEWYRAVLKAAGLAEPSAVRGCMVIKPWGYGIWEQVQRQLDDLFKQEKCCENAYFPLFIPTSFFAAEAEHVQGFAKECAVVTHYRMKLEDGKMIPDPEAKLGEPLIVRPTSETIIGDSMRQWIHSHRDLPLLLNQWCNVVRWEHETKPFLRTTEFLWQEGHCAFANEQEARANSLKMARVYEAFMTQWCALPVIMGEKSPGERFAGATQTYCLEAMMQDGKAVQAGTSHYLGQNFAHAANIKFTDGFGKEQHAHTTSWGVSTRLIGTMIMTHSDDDGLRVPPRLATHHVVIIPSGHKDIEARDSYIQSIENLCKHMIYEGRPLAMKVDRRDIGPADKRWEWIKKGVPIRLEVGAREAKDDTVTLSRRDQHHEISTVVKLDLFIQSLSSILTGIQTNYFDQAKKFRDDHLRTDITTSEEFFAFWEKEENIGFVKAKWSGDEEAEAALKKDHKVTIRCLPEPQSGTEGICVLTGKPAKIDAIFGRSY